MEVEEVLKKIGYGWTQKKLYLLIQAIHYPVIAHFVALSFIGVNPGWTCGETKNHSESDKCLAYSGGTCEPQYNEDITSIVTEWNLICDKSSLAKYSQSVFFVGTMLGAWLWGTVADRIGRRKVYFATILLSIISGLGYSLAPTYLVFVLFRFLAAVCVAGIVLSMFVLSMELTGTEGRSHIVTLSYSIFALCYPILAFQSYLITDWRLFASITNLSGLLLMLILWRIIPESPRWLLVQGREEEARAVLSGIASGNGVEMPAGQLKKPSLTTSTEPVSVLDVFRGSVIRKRTMVLIVAWFANCMLYYALTMSSGELGGNRYLNVGLSGLVEIPAYLASYVLLDKYGRKKMHGCFLTFGGMACLCVALLQWLDNGSLLIVLVAMVGKLAVSGSFGVIYLYTIELFPTQVRNIGTGVATIGGRFGGIFSPIVLLLDKYSVGLPMLVLGTAGTLAGLLSLTLPETLDQPMPETLRELERQKV